MSQDHAIPRHGATTRRRIVTAAAGLGLARALTMPALAAQPARRRVICPFAPGGIADQMSCAVVAEAQAMTGETWVVENIGGAGGLIGSIRAARSAPDGRTLVLAAAGMIRTLGGQGGGGAEFDPLRDLRAVILTGSMPIVCVTPPALTATTLRGHAEGLRNAAAPFVYATAGHATTSHVIGAAIARAAGLAGVHVPYAGSAPAVAGVMGGHVPCAVIDPLPVAAMLAAGTLRCLGISSAARHPRLADVQTFGEQGFASAALTSWTGFLAPAATPNRIADELGQLLGAVVRSAPVRQALEAGFIDGPLLHGDAAQASAAEDVRSFQQAMAEAGIVPG